MKIKYQLLLTHGLLVVLALAIVLINVIAYKDMESDANIINQAGKLRMLSYDMAQLSNRISAQKDSTNTGDLKSTLHLRIDEFDSTLKFLSENKKNSGPFIEHPQSIVKLEKTAKEWREVFKPAYESIASNGIVDNSCERINNNINSYVNDINEMVTSFSVYARGKSARLLR